MSQLGQTETSTRRFGISARPPEADFARLPDRPLSAKTEVGFSAERLSYWRITIISAARPRLRLA
jgi:hypothetical protein